MPTSVARKNLGLDAMYPNDILVSLHSGPPGDTGANEIVASGRKPATLAPAANAQKVCTVQPAAHDVEAGTTVDQIGFWTTGGVWIGSKDVTNETYGGAGQGQVTVQPFTMNDAAGS